MPESKGTYIKVYYTSVSGSREIKMRQAEVARILDTKKIKYELIDVSLHESLLKEMRQKAGNPTAVPPQIFNRDDYCGDYQKMFEANENCEFLSFLKMGSADHEC